MNRPELYNKTVDILYQAYFNDTLEHGWCTACVVGNLIAANNGYTLKNDNRDAWFDGEKAIPVKWSNVFMTSCGTDQSIDLYNYFGEAKRQIDSTGYTYMELAKIEFAFESTDGFAGSEDLMFNGLSAVLEVLKQIHEVTDEDLLQANNKRFADHYKLKTACV